MSIFVAGASGTIGIPLVRALVAAKLPVIALTRSPGKQAELRALGASVVLADALDRDVLIAAVRTARPTHVIHQLTALPKDGPRRASDLEATNRLRIDGTRNLLDAAIAAGARRFIVGSFAILAPRGQATDSSDGAAVAVHSMENQALEARRHRGRHPPLRAVLRPRRPVNGRDDRDDSQAQTSGGPRRQGATSAHQCRRCGERDGACA